MAITPSLSVERWLIILVLSLFSPSALFCSMCSYLRLSSSLKCRLTNADLIFCFKAVPPRCISILYFCIIFLCYISMLYFHAVLSYVISITEISQVTSILYFLAEISYGNFIGHFHEEFPCGTSVWYYHPVLPAAGTFGCRRLPAGALGGPDTQMPCLRKYIRSQIIT